MKKATNNKKLPRATEVNARDAYLAHTMAIHELLAKLEDGMIDVELQQPDWGHVGDVGRARELLIRAAHVLGVITEEEAKKHGCSL